MLVWTSTYRATQSKIQPPTLLPMTDGFHMSTETDDEQVAKPNPVRYTYDADVVHLH